MAGSSTAISPAWPSRTDASRLAEVSEASVHAQRFIPPAPFPGERDISILQQMIKGLTQPIEGWPRAVFEDLSWRPQFPGTPLFLMNPDAIRGVLADQAGCFSQGAMFRRMMRPVWGEGMFTSEGQAWRWQRHASAPAFRPAHMHALAPFMSRAAESALGRWGAESSINTYAEAALITFDVILDAVLSGGEDFDRMAARTRMAAFVAHVLKAKISYFLAPDAYHEGKVNSPGPQSAALRADIEGMIRRRRTAPPRGDLVDLLLAARDPETGQAMDDSLLRDNLLGFIMAGHETSAQALTWALYLASTHATTADRVRAEVAAVAGEGPIGADHVERLVFTRQVISEALRLYPSALQLYRVCVRPTEVAGVAMKVGQRIVIPVYALHRHRRYWRDPNVFDPDRFAPEAPPPDRHVYMPFGAGPRICLGAAFAMTELVVVLATLMRGANFVVAPGHRVWPDRGLTMRPKDGLPMIVKRR
jgi:cytochrome P450